MWSVRGVVFVSRCPRCGDWMHICWSATFTGSHCPSAVHQLLVQLSVLVESVSVLAVELLVAAVDEAITTSTGVDGASAGLRTPGIGTAVLGMGYDTIDEYG